MTTASPTGTYVEPNLDDYRLEGADPEAITVVTRQGKAVREMADGSRRAFYQAAGEGLPMIVTKRTWTLKYASLKTLYDTLEQLLSVPDPHAWCSWKMEHYAYQPDGVRTEFSLPWVPALHTLSPGRGLGKKRLQAVVVHGMGGGQVVYEVADISQAAYDAGSPPSGTMWFRDQDVVFKFASAPSATKTLFVRYVPLFSVVSGGQSSKQYTDNAREPRDIVLQEM